MIPKLVVDFDARDAVPEALEEFKTYIRVTSRIVARDFAGDRSVAEDLAQEAAIVLWELDPTRFDANDVEYLRSAMYTRMKFMGRKERRARGGNRRVEVGGL
jgi:DNA-directed RNA polymerase specialized sigma24 family protein